MTLYTSNGAGSWSDTTKWTPTPSAGGPAAGDSVVIGHAIAYDSVAGGSQNGNGIIGAGSGTALAGTGTVGTGGISSVTLAGSGTSFLSQLKVGDTVIIGANVRTVTAIANDTSLTMGRAATIAAGQSFTYTPGAIYLTSAGTLTLNTGTTLAYRGDVAITGTGTTSDRLILSAGSILEHDSSTSPSASTCYYVVRMGTADSQFPRLKVNGTINSPCIIRSNAGGGNGGSFINGGFIGGCQINATYCTFLRLGNSTVGGVFQPWLTNAATSELTLNNCTFDNCQTITFGTTAGAAANITLSRNTWQNSTVANITFTVTTGFSGLRNVNNNFFDHIVNCNTFAGLSLTSNIFAKNVTPSGSASPVLNQYNLYIFSGNTNSQNMYGTSLNNYYLFDASTDNPHGVNTGDADTNFDGLVFDCVNMASNGDMILAGAAGSLRQVSVKRCFVLPNLTNWGPGELISPIATNYEYTAEHNTVTCTNSPENGVGVYGETYAGRANTLYASLQGNISWTPTGKGPGAIFLRHNQSTVGDVIATDGGGNVLAGHNGANNTVTVAAGIYKAVFGASGGYADGLTSPTTPMFSVTTGLGAGDVIANPSFVDTTRNFATFDSAYLGNTATAWAASHSYSVGDFVSVNGQTTMYNSATVNFRCVTAHTSGIAGDGATGKPGNSWSQQTVTYTGTAPTSGSYVLAYYPSTGGASVAVSSQSWNGSAATLATAVQTAAATAGDTITVTGSGGTFQTAPITLTYTSGGNPFFTPGLLLSTSSLGGGATASVPNWRTNWELATHYRMRQSVNLTYDANVRQATPRDLLWWVYAGFRPTNTSYNNATFSGDTATTDAAGNPLGGALGAMAWIAAANFSVNTPYVRPNYYNLLDRG